MAVNLASPGILVREVDLTIGRVDATSGSIGALVAPFTKGPVEEPQLIESEEDLLQTFGQPYSIDNHYEYWMVASSYLAYGGTMQVIRADDFNTQTGVGLKYAFVGAASSIRIKSDTHYNQLGYDDNTITGVTVASKTPGTYANGIRVAIIDAKADQILTVSGISTVGLGITQSAAGRIVAGAGGTSVLDGYIKGIVTEVGTGTISVKTLAHVSAAGTVTNVNYQNGGVYNFATGNISASAAGTILEKHLNLSKAKHAEYSVGSTAYWRKYLATNSQYIYGGSSPAGITTTGFTNATATAIGNLDADSGWIRMQVELTLVLLVS